MKFHDWIDTLFVIVAGGIFLVIFIVIIIAGCAEPGKSTVSAKSGTFDMEKIDSDWIDNFQLYEDTETHIQYIVYKKGETVAISPRYLYMNGVLYTEGGTE